MKICSTVCGETREQAVSNALLIAAAPELLQALKLVRGWWEAREENIGEGAGNDLAFRVFVFDRVLAAISKAEERRRHNEQAQRQRRFICQRGRF